MQINVLLLQFLLKTKQNKTKQFLFLKFAKNLKLRSDTRRRKLFLAGRKSPARGAVAHRFCLRPFMHSVISCQEMADLEVIIFLNISRYK